MGFKVGDKVRFVAKNSDFGLLNYNGLGFIGDVGIVTEVGGLIRVLEKHETRAFLYDKRCLKLMKFKVGDIVEPKKKAGKVYSLTARENNFKGIVTSVYDGGFMVQNYNNSKEIRYAVAEEYFKLLHRPEFKVGDKLAIVGNLSSHYFDEGDIVTVHRVCYDDFEDELVNYYVSDDFNNHDYVLESETVILEDEIKVNQSHRFKIGEKLIISLEKYGHNFKNGEEVEVTQYCYDDELTGVEEPYYEVQSTLSHLRFFVNYEEVEEIKVEQNHKFKVGDKVRAQSESTPEPIEVQIGITKVIFSDRYTIAIRGGKKAISKCHPDDEYDARIGLKVAIEKLDVKIKTVRIGDKVRVVSGYTDFHYHPLGQIVEVISIADDGSVNTKGKSAYGNNITQTLYPRHYEVI